MPINLMPRVISPLAVDSLTWAEQVLPDRVRDWVRFQLGDLGIFYVSFDGGATYFSAAGPGVELSGNFSKQSVYFKVPAGTGEVVTIVKDKVL